MFKNTEVINAFCLSFFLIYLGSVHRGGSFTLWRFGVLSQFECRFAGTFQLFYLVVYDQEIMVVSALRRKRKLFAV